jgi:hypothetical protein
MGDRVYMLRERGGGRGSKRGSNEGYGIANQRERVGDKERPREWLYWIKTENETVHGRKVGWERVYVEEVRERDPGEGARRAERQREREKELEREGEFKH